MAFSTPYVTDEYTAYKGDVITTDLSFAVSLIDDYTKGKPIGRIKVAIKETGKKAIENPSGYYIFSGLKVNSCTISINSELYFPPEEIAVNVSSTPDPDPKNSVCEIILKPKPEYPFPANATLVRGKVVTEQTGQNHEKQVSEKPVSGIKVGVKEKDIEDITHGNITDSRGEFVLYFTDIIKDEEDVTLVINGENGPSIKVKKGKAVSVGKISKQ